MGANSHIAKRLILPASEDGYTYYSTRFLHCHCHLNGKKTAFPCLHARESRSQTCSTTSTQRDISKASKTPTVPRVSLPRCYVSRAGVRVRRTKPNKQAWGKRVFTKDCFDMRPKATFALTRGHTLETYDQSSESCGITWMPMVRRRACSLINECPGQGLEFRSEIHLLGACRMCKSRHSFQWCGSSKIQRETCKEILHLELLTFCYATLCGASMTSTSTSEPSLPPLFRMLHQFVSFTENPVHCPSKLTPHCRFTATPQCFDSPFAPAPL